MIMNEAAYQRGIARRIRANAAKSRRDAFRAANADWEELESWLFGTGAFADRRVTKDPADQAAYDAQYKAIWELADREGFDPHADLWDLDEQFDARNEPNPLTIGIFGGDFGATLLSMRDNLLDWGGLTDRQAEMVRKALARKREWVAKDAERRAEKRAADLGSRHIGTVGERLKDLTVTVNKVLSFEGQFGTTFINLCKTPDGNVVVVKGTKRLPEGATISLTATVKAHDVRDGIPQTVLNRPVW